MHGGRSSWPTNVVIVACDIKSPENLLMNMASKVPTCVYLFHHFMTFLHLTSVSYSSLRRLSHSNWFYLLFL